MCIDEKEAGKLIAKVDMLEEKAERAEEVFYNNGLIERVARIEENIIFILENSKLNTSLNNKVLEKIEILDATVMSHLLNKDLHSFKGLFLKKDIVAWVVTGFVISIVFLHSILPQDIDLWEFIKKILGY